MGKLEQREIKELGWKGWPRTGSEREEKEKGGKKKRREKSKYINERKEDMEGKKRKFF